MAERLTRNSKFSIYNQNDIEAMYDKLAEVEDVMEEYGLERVEELDDFFANYKVSDTLTEERIKEIAVNEQRKVFQSMIKEITEKECNNLYNELNTWENACKLACDVLRDINYKIYNEDRIDFENIFYQQAKTEGNDE